MSSKGPRVEVVLAPHHPATAATEGNTVLRMAKSGRFCIRTPRAVEGADKRLTPNLRLWGCSADPGLQLSSQMCSVKRAFAPPTAPEVRLCSHSRRVASREIAAVSLNLAAPGSRGGETGLPGQAGHAPASMPSKGSRVEVVIAPHHPATAATEGNTVLRETATLLS